MASVSIRTANSWAPQYQMRGTGGYNWRLASLCQNATILQLHTTSPAFPDQAVRGTCGDLGAVLAAPVHCVQVVVPVGSMHAHHRLAACSQETLPYLERWLLLIHAPTAQARWC